ncbi:translation factor GTPase family protein [Pedobacter chitinilyticus]|uniref:Elongation factor G n=1 Tax=Pedobacter chitinilyticus TaxID=2233776 RepID=A0A3S3PF77_9SPHI|nr:hypothetical protein [Pedobacter chitinilyticus]RWU03944.1 hypothetical protein DPV69_19875 [Pedobacter chitinilyticus]
MTSQEFDRNLQSLKVIYRNQGKTNNGFNVVQSFIKEHNSEEFDHLLRFHIPKGVYGEELIKRFEIDALIEWYNLLFIGVLAGYLDRDLDRDTISELQLVLNNPSIVNYYEERYPYLLTSFTLQFFSTDRKEFKIPEDNSAAIGAYHIFMTLNRILREDEDVVRFLGMLDYVWYEDDSQAGYTRLNGVLEVLGSSSVLKEVLSLNEKNEMAKGVWGFIKFVNVLSEFRSLLESIGNEPLLQSAMWMYHGYYFDRMNAEMNLFFDKAFKNLGLVLNDESLFLNVAEGVYQDQELPMLDEDDLSVIAKKATAKSLDDVMWMLNPNRFDAIKNYFKNRIYGPLRVIAISVEPKIQSEIERLSRSITKLAEEDSTLGVELDEDTGQIILRCINELHLSKTILRINHEFKVEINTGIPQVAYKEALTASVLHREIYKKQSGGRGKFADIQFEIGPADQSFLSEGKGGFQFVNRVVGGVVPEDFIPFIRKGFETSMNYGPMAGFPLENMKITLFGGSFHTVESDALSFELCAKNGFREAVYKAKPIILEPIMLIEILTPEQFFVDILVDLNRRRCMLQGMDKRNNLEVLTAYVPLNEMLDYLKTLHSISEYRASYTTQFSHYESVPQIIQKDILAKLKSNSRINN